MKIVSYPRFILSVSIILIIIVALLAVGMDLFFNQSAPEYQESELVEVVVRRGDTVWDLANEHLGSDTNIQKQIMNIYVLNDLSSEEAIVPGQVLKIPANSNTMQASN